jgi:hypothetical protein
MGLVFIAIGAAMLALLGVDAVLSVRSPFEGVRAFKNTTSPISQAVRER